MKIIRILDTIGACLYIVYGIFIHSWANIALNVVLVCIQIYRLIELKEKVKRMNENKETSEHMINEEKIITDSIKESLSKSISEIIAFFDFDKVAEIEESYFNECCDNDEDSLVDVIKEFALENLYECVKDFSKQTFNCYLETKYHLHFDYIYDPNTPRMELKYIPVSWE